MTPPIAIVLNGASSSGKTSIARALQRLSAVPVLHASLDVFTDMFDWASVSGEELRRECHRTGVDNFHAALGILASGPFPVVVDHVFERRAWFEACCSALRGRRTLHVGVRCPLEVLEMRERARGDRTVGRARWQADRVHEALAYDLELDTSVLSPDQAAAAILDPAAIPRRVHPSPGSPVTPPTPGRRDAAHD